MPLLKDGKLIDDPWVTVDDNMPLPPVGPVIISLERWFERREELAGRNTPLGIRLNSDQSPSSIADDIHRFSVVALDFPKFVDGRAYSYARLLRERYGFNGEVRAVGNVLLDQYLFMRGCGFDAFEVEGGNRAEEWRCHAEAIGANTAPNPAPPFRWGTPEARPA